MNPLLLTDYYKTEHQKMYDPGTTKIYTNLTPRKSRNPNIKGVVVFGIQHFLQRYLIEEFKTHFFNRPLEEVIEEYKYAINVDTTHIENLHKLGYLPIHIKALPEGSICPIGVPMMTITNTIPEFFWLTNYLETLISCSLWQSITSATLADQYKKLFSKYSLETTGNTDFVQWQGHDFSMRGMSSVESAIYSGMGHLLSFTGTDTIPAIYELKKYYDATGLIGASVPATEHSIMCLGQKESEIETFRRLLKLYPTGILSVVSDTWDLWKVLTEYLPELKEAILTRDGKLVIRPDSGDPVDILCGIPEMKQGEEYSTWSGNAFRDIPASEAEEKGVIELLWDVFGGTVNDLGYKVLDPHIGAIYGDSITLDRAEQICERLKAKGFASTNWVAGIGSYTYQYNTRDTFGFAMKATYGEVLELDDYEYSGLSNGSPVYKSIGREIFKDPITDDGTKRSAKGLLRVNEVLVPDSYGKLHHSTYQLKDQCTEEEEKGGALESVFLDSQMIQKTNLNQIRNILSNQ